MQFFNQSWAHRKVEVAWMLGWIQWQKIVKHGLFFRPVKINIFISPLSSLCVIFLNDVLTAEHMLFLRGSRERQLRWMRAHRPRDASRKRETSGSSRWKAMVAKTVSLLILVRETTSFLFVLFHPYIRHMHLLKCFSWYIQCPFYGSFFVNFASMYIWIYNYGYNFQKQVFTPRTEISVFTSHQKWERTLHSGWQTTTSLLPNLRGEFQQRKVYSWLP